MWSIFISSFWGSKIRRHTRRSAAAAAAAAPPTSSSSSSSATPVTADDEDDDIFDPTYYGEEKEIRSFRIAHIDRKDERLYHAISEREKIMVTDNPFALNVANSLRQFREKKNFIHILRKMHNNPLVWNAIQENQTRYYTKAANNPFGAAGDEIEILDPANFPTGNEPVLIWLKGLMCNLMDVPLDPNLPNPGNDVLRNIPSSSSHNLAMSEQTKSMMTMKRLLINTMNALAFRFARLHGLTFASFKAASFKSHGDPLQAMEDTARLIPQWNRYAEGKPIEVERKPKVKRTRRIGPRNRPHYDPDAEIPSINEMKEDAIADAVFGTERLSGVEGNIPLEIIGRVQEILQKMHGPMSENPFEEEIATSYPKSAHTENLEIADDNPAAPSSSSASSSSSSSSRSIPLPPNENDVADAVEAAIDEFFDQRSNYIEGGVLMASNAVLVDVAVNVIAADSNHVVKEYEFATDSEASDPEVHFHYPKTTDQGPAFTDDKQESSDEEDPEVTINYDLIKKSAVQSVAVRLRGGHSGSRHPRHVHKDPAHCHHIATEFVKAWRSAKQKVYRSKGIRHFPIKQAFFHDGAVCHRCYQLVMQHHERYHLASGKTVTHKVIEYPRKRIKPAKEEKGYKQKAAYKETRKEAKAESKYLKEASTAELAKRAKKKKERRR